MKPKEGTELKESKESKLCILDITVVILTVIAISIIILRIIWKI